MRRCRLCCAAAIAGGGSPCALRCSPTRAAGGAFRPLRALLPEGQRVRFYAPRLCRSQTDSPTSTDVLRAFPAESDRALLSRSGHGQIGVVAGQYAGTEWRPGTRPPSLLELAFHLIGLQSGLDQCIRRIGGQSHIQPVAKDRVPGQSDPPRVQRCRCRLFRQRAVSATPSSMSSLHWDQGPWGSWVKGGGSQEILS